MKKLVSCLALAVVCAATAQAKNQTFQYADAVSLPDLAVLNGAGALTRSNNSLTARVNLTCLDMSAAYTVWWVIFNKPSACATSPCTGDDLGTAAVNGSVFNATGFITNVEGTANVVFATRAGAPAEGREVLVGNGLRPGAGRKAEVHLIVRTHGALINGRVAEQTNEVGGGCDVNTCVDQQAVIFLP